jgi:hypothetical protein
MQAGRRRFGVRGDRKHSIWHEDKRHMRGHVSREHINLTITVSVGEETRHAVVSRAAVLISPWCIYYITIKLYAYSTKTKGKSRSTIIYINNSTITTRRHTGQPSHYTKVHHAVMLGDCTRRVSITWQWLSSSCMRTGLVRLAQLSQLNLKEALQVLRNHHIIQHLPIPALVWKHNPTTVSVVTMLITNVTHRGCEAWALRGSM